MHKCSQKELLTCESHCWHYYAAKYVLFDCPYKARVEDLLWSKNKNYRLLADLAHHDGYTHRYSAIGCTYPAREGDWVSTSVKCAGLHGRAICLRELQRSVRMRRGKTYSCVVGTPVSKSNNDFVNGTPRVPLQLFSSDFCHLLNDTDYVLANDLYENASCFLTIMWTPTSSSTLASSFAVPKFKLLNSYVSTNAMLPSEECFLSWEKEEINRLAYKWIGNAPLQHDVESVMRFMRHFSGLFLHPKRDKSYGDPIGRKKIEAQSQFLVGLLDTIFPSCNIKPVEPRNKVFVQDAQPTDSCVPLQWEDLLKEWNVFVHEAPEGCRFLHDEKISKVGQRSAAVVGPPQEGYCFSKAYPNSELNLGPDFVRGTSLPFSRGPYHRLTRARFRALDYVRCHCPKAKRMACPLCPESEDLQHEEFMHRLPGHKYLTWSRYEDNIRACDPLISRTFPRWLRHDPRTQPLTVDPPKSCPPSLSNPNRRAFEVNPHIPLHPPSLKPCFIYKTRTSIGAKETRDANVSNACRRRQPTKLPILFDRLKFA